MSYNILYIGIGPHSGGPIISLIQLIQNIDKDKYVPYIFSLPSAHENTLKQLLNISKVEIIEENIWINNWLHSVNKQNEQTIWQKLKAPGRILRTLYNSYKIAKIIKQYNIELVHTNIELTLEGAIAAWLTNRPHIWHVRAPIGKDGAVSHPFGKKFICSIMSYFSNIIIVNSISTKKSIENFIDEQKIKLIYNGINIDDFSIKKNQGKLKKLFNLDSSTKVIASIGYLSEIKGGAEFIKIAHQVCQYVDNVVFVWIGPSIEQEKCFFCKNIFDDIELYGLKDKVLFTGERNDINILLQDVDILLQPMVNGSWSRVVLEAMAASIPVVAIEQNLTSEIIEHEKDGFLVQNEVEASNLIKTLLCKDDLLAKITKNGLDKIKANFTNQMTAEKIMSIYHEIFIMKVENR